MPNNKLFDFVAPLYDKVIGIRDPKRLIDLLELPINGTLLDAGGGTGRVSIALKNHVGKLFISDLSRSMLIEAKAKDHDDLIQTSSEKNPFPSDFFDRIIVIDALHHFPNQKETIKELIRILKPNGKILIEEPNIHRFSVKLIALAEKLALMNSHIHSPEEIRIMIEDNGLQTTIHTDDKFAAYIIGTK